MGAESGRDLANWVTEELRRRGFSAYLVGGCVRDLLLGNEPQDFDVATSARPEQVLELFPEAREVGAHFGVVILDKGEAHVEVATYRSDHSYKDGRRPEAVKFESDPRQDAVRRDFTINALMLDPGSEEILDFVGGRNDLQARTIRAIGDPDARFREDHLRMLRAVRFAARLGFSIEPGTMAAIQRNSGSIHRVSAERTRDELTRILTEGGARRGFELLDQSGLLHEVLPEVEAMQGVEQPPQFHPEGDVWIHTLLMLEQLPKGASASLAWGVLLHDVGKPPTFFRAHDRIRFHHHVEKGIEIARGISSRLKFSGEEGQRVEELIAHHMRPKDVHRMKESTLKRFLRMDHFHEHLELHRLDCLSSHRDLTNYYFLRQRSEQAAPEELRPPRLITGDDLLSLGVAPGPRYREILTAVEDAQLEGSLTTHEQAMEWVIARWGSAATHEPQS
jgi:poly(A) polymerase